MAVAPKAKVAGLSELQAQLRRIDKDLPKELSAANKEAAEIVAAEARGRATSLGGVAAKVAPSIKALSQQRSASVALGGPKYPMAQGAEFGAAQNSQRGPFHSSNRGAYDQVGWRQFDEWTGSGSDAGYFLYPSIRARIGDVIDAYADRLDALTRRAFPS